MNYLDFFENKLKHNGSKFTIILGSGFHREALGNNSILSSWPLLMYSLDPKIVLTRNYLLDFEKLILERTSLINSGNEIQFQPHDVEKLILKDLANDLKREQKKILKFYKESYPLTIFNPQYVSDIISLNFDTVAEEICLDHISPNKRLKEAKKSVFKFESKPDLTIEYTEITSESQESIRFWYPHGSISSKVNKGIKLGIREYSKSVINIERLRKYSKARDKAFDQTTIPISWYSQLVNNPVLILGAEISDHEFDLWFALVNRMRNGTSNNQRPDNLPAFQMKEFEKDNDSDKNLSIRADFYPIFDNMTFKQQWENLFL
jgi:hypothetical protein